MRRSTPWANSAYAMAVNINRSFKAYGVVFADSAASNRAAPSRACPRTPFPLTTAGSTCACPTEIAISDRREAELAKNGFMPLVYKKNTDFAAFIGAQSLPQAVPVRRPRRDIQRHVGRTTTLLVRHRRFAHYLKVHRARQDRVIKEADDMQRLAAELDCAVCGRRPGALQ